MRRVLLVLSVAALVAAMMVSAGPAAAKIGGNTNDFDNGSRVVQSNGNFFGFGDDFDDDDDDFNGIHFGGLDDIDDIDDFDDFDNGGTRIRVG